jgi:ribonuclease HII
MAHAMSSAEKKALLCEKKALQLVVDGNYFNPYTYFNKQKQRIESIPHVCVEGGDNKYSMIAAASILAKVERDKYIEDLCAEHPELIEKYDLANNKGYGTRKHMAGIMEHGLSEWHRKTFGSKKI